MFLRIFHFQLVNVRDWIQLSIFIKTATNWLVFLRNINKVIRADISLYILNEKTIPMSFRCVVQTLCSLVVKIIELDEKMNNFPYIHLENGKNSAN